MCLCPHWGIPQLQVFSQVSGPRSFLGSTPVQGSFSGLWSQSLSRWGGTQAQLGRVPQFWLGGGTPSQDRTGVHPCQDWGTSPWPGLDQSTPWRGLGYSPSGTGVPHPLARTGLGYLRARTWCKPSWDWRSTPPPYHETEQQSKHLLRGGRYASFGHAGGLSCSFFKFFNNSYAEALALVLLLSTGISGKGSTLVFKWSPTLSAALYMNKVL